MKMAFVAPLALVISLTLATPAAFGDLDLRQPDKELHVAVSYGLNMTIYHFTKNLWISSLSTLGIGILKEITDKDHSDSWEDFQADVLGTGLSAIVLSIEF